MKNILTSTVPVIELLLQTFLEGTGTEAIQIFILSRHLYFRIIISELAICILLIISLIKDKSLSPILRCNYNIPLISTKSINRILVLILDSRDQNQNQRLNEVKNLSVAHYNTK